MLTARPPLELQLDARPELAATLRRRLSDWLEAAGVTRKDVFEVTLATTEAFENAVRHPRRPRAPMVDLRVSSTDSSLCVSLRDHGVWDGRQAGKAHGLGLPMMRLGRGADRSRHHHGDHVAGSLAALMRLRSRASRPEHERGGAGHDDPLVRGQCSGDESLQAPLTLEPPAV